MLKRKKKKRQESCECDDFFKKCKHDDCHDDCHDDWNDDWNEDWNDDWNDSDCDDHKRKDCREKQTHVHEFLGSVGIAEIKKDPHNHRFAGVSGEVIPMSGGNHRHRIRTKTDFFEDHFHEINVLSGPAIKVDDHKHVHFVEGETSVNDGHAHDFIFATLIEDPLN